MNMNRQSKKKIKQNKIRTANFQKKKGVEKQKKEVRLEKEVAQKYAALKTQYVRSEIRRERKKDNVNQNFSRMNYNYN